MRNKIFIFSAVLAVSLTLGYNILVDSSSITEERIPEGILELCPTFVQWAQIVGVKEAYNIGMFSSVCLAGAMNEV